VRLAEPERAIPPAGRAVRAAAIAGLGTALPAHRVTNEELAPRIGVDAEWILRRTGIRERRHARPSDRLSDLAACAGANALASADLPASELDVVLVATLSQDQLLPNAAPQVAHALGAVRAGAVDLGAACTGFLSGLALATALVESGRARHVLLIGAEILSRHTGLGDRLTAGLFGDGAGAVVISASAVAHIGPVVLRADGARASLITADRDPGLVRMDGHATYQAAVAALAEVTQEAVAAVGLRLDDVDRFVYHQANGRILHSVREQLGLEEARVVDAIAAVGNTSAASIPLALADAAPRRDERLLLGAVGAGFTWGACVIEWGAA
jgi:3-oxoacyl-[acyl-carrier-protein] synthase III